MWQRGADYTLNYPYAYATYSPCFATEFQELYRQIRPHTVVTEDRCFVLHRLARQCAHLPGAVAECGVYRGGTAFLIAHALADAKKPLHLFDTFAGMPAEADADPGIHAAGDLGDTSLERVEALLRPFSSVTCHPGTLPATLASVAGEAFSLVHLDVDLYETTRDCCSFFYPRLVGGGMLVIDDYGFEAHRHTARKAIDEFFADKPEVTLPLRTGQCLVIRIP